MVRSTAWLAPDRALTPWVLRRYQAAGIPHYWVVDPRRRTITTYDLVDGTYELTGSHGPGTIFRPELFPGLAIPVDTLWG